MPTQLARLFRFFRHEAEVAGVIWNVASAPYDTNSRLYRVMYKDELNTELSFDVEQIITLNSKWRKEIEPIIQSIVGVLEKEVFAKEFWEASLAILQEDPWLEEYICELTCNLRQNSECSDKS